MYQWYNILSDGSLAEMVEPLNWDLLIAVDDEWGGTVYFEDLEDDEVELLYYRGNQGLQGCYLDV